MSRKHYRKMAEIIRNMTTGDAATDAALHRMAEELCIMFAQDNPRFNRIKFLAACGIEQ